MAIANTLDKFLASKNAHYEMLEHRTTDTSFNSAATSHLPSYQVSKAVMLEDESNQLLMAVIPSGNRLALDEVNHITGKYYHLIQEQQLSSVFSDCELGATPGMAAAYGLDMLVDDSLLHTDKVYIEAGDHQHLLGFKHDDYLALLKDVPHGSIVGSAIGMPKESDQFDTEWTV